MNQHFRDMLSALSAAGAEFLVVGAHALAAHGYTRATGDLDVWIRRSDENAPRVLEAIKLFGAPLLDLTLEDLKTPDIVFQIGIVPFRIDILTSIAGVDFDDAWPDRVTVNVEGMELPVIGRQQLLANKRATGRPKDALDADWLESNGERGT
jgi:hypothetical protein